MVVEGKLRMNWSYSRKVHKRETVERIAQRYLECLRGLIEHCRSRIACYKVPRRVEFIAGELPKSGTNKILKRKLREPYWKDAGRRVSCALAAFLLTSAAALAQRGDLTIYSVIGSATTGAISGQAAAYILGRWRGRRFFCHSYARRSLSLARTVPTFITKADERAKEATYVELE